MFQLTCSKWRYKSQNNTDNTDKIREDFYRDIFQYEKMNGNEILL